MNTSLNGDQLANDIWAMLGATPSAIADNATAFASDNQTNIGEQAAMSNIPDLATEILSKLEQKKETVAAHLGISKSEVETMPFDLTALEQAGIFLNIDATGFSVMKSSGKTDGGATARTISYLLNWMQDNRDVLVFATANDVRDLESEQFRIGRFLTFTSLTCRPKTTDRRFSASIYKNAH